MTDLWRLSAADLATLIRSKQVSATEAARAANSAGDVPGTFPVDLARRAFLQRAGRAPRCATGSVITLSRTGRATARIGCAA